MRIESFGGWLGFVLSCNMCAPLCLWGGASSLSTAATTQDVMLLKEKPGPAGRPAAHSPPRNNRQPPPSEKDISIKSRLAADDRLSSSFFFAIFTSGARRLDTLSVPSAVRSVYNHNNKSYVMFLFLCVFRCYYYEGDDGGRKPQKNG